MELHLASNSKILEVNREVLKILLKLDTTKALGPDGLSPIFFLMCANTLVSSITKIFKVCLNISDIPREWKVAHVVPIYKKGSKSDKENYRPISLLNAISKVLKRAIYNHVFPITRIW